MNRTPMHGQTLQQLRPQVTQQQATRNHYLLQAIAAKIDAMGVGMDVEINGADAVDALAEIRRLIEEGGAS